MKKFFFLLVVILFIPFCRVNALDSPVYFQSPIPATMELYLNNNYWTVSGYQTVNVNTPANFQLYASFANNMSISNVYVRYTYCVDNAISAGYSGDTQVSDINTIRTNIPCRYYNSSYTGGRIAFTSYRYVIPTTTGTVFTNTVAVVPLVSNVSMGLLGVDFSLVPFPQYSETDVILQSTDSINNRLSQVIDSNNNILYAVNETNTKLDNIYSFLENNFLTCSSSTNLWKDIPVSTKSGVTLSYSNGIYTLNGTASANGSFYVSTSYSNGIYTLGANNSSTISASTYLLLETSGGTRYTLTMSNTNNKSTYNISSNITALVIVFAQGTTYNNFSFKPQLVEGSTLPPFSAYGSQVCESSLNKQNQLQEQQNQIQQERNDFMNDDNVDESSSTANSFFSGFTSNDHGLTGIITAPLTLIESLTSKTCSPLVVPLPFVNSNLTLPCMSSIYSQYFGSFYTMYQVITFGIVSYWVLVRIFAMVKDFKNPEHDEVEVMDL